MAVKNRIYDFLFYLLIGTLYANALSRALVAATILEIPQASLFLWCAVCILVFYGVFFNRVTALSAFGGLALVLLALYLYLRWQRFEAAWYLELRALLEELAGFARDELPYREAYNRPIGIGIAAGVSLLTAVNLLVRFNFYILTGLAVGVYAVPIFMDWGSSDYAVGLGIFCFLVLLAKKLNRCTLPREKREPRANAGLSAALLPVCLLLVGCAHLLPKPEVPRYFLDAADNLFYDFGQDQTMFFSEESGLLGGPTSLGNRYVMEVLSERPVNLGGLVMDTYTGVSWNISEEQQLTLTRSENEWYTASEYPKKLREMQEYFMRYYGWSTSMVTVYIGENRTRSLFSPPFRSSIWISDSVSLQQGSLGRLTVKNPLAKHSVYAIAYIPWNYSNEYLVYVLRSLQPGDDVGGVDPEPYLQLPPTLPDRVGELALQLTAGCDNVYDRMKALESYLVGFPYTLEPERLPAGEDFVDYFLFTGQEGYCVYYASALAVMGRCAGIPTRYVEGYAMPEERNESGNYTVTNAQAHAWAEAFFPGFGWVPFEATPSNYYAFYTGEPGTAAEHPEPEDESPDRDANLIAGIGAEEPEAPEPPITEEPEQPASSSANRPSLPQKVALFLLAAAVLAALALWGLVLLYRARLNRVDAQPDREAAIAYYGRLLEAVGSLGYPIRPNETAHAHAQRVGGQITFEDGATLFEPANVFALASYSANGISEQDRALVERCYRQLLQRMSATKRGRLKTLVERYILMRY